MERFPVPTQTEIHVWYRSLEVSVAERDALFALLDPEERRRAARFRFETGRDAFITSHGWLRTLLGRYLNAAPPASNSPSATVESRPCKVRLCNSTFRIRARWPRAP